MDKMIVNDETLVNEISFNEEFEMTLVKQNYTDGTFKYIIIDKHSIGTNIFIKSELSEHIDRIEKEINRLNEILSMDSVKYNALVSEPYEDYIDLKQRMLKRLKIIDRNNNVTVFFFVNDKRFGKNYIDYKIENKLTGEVETGKCGNHKAISDIFFGLRDKHGEEAVKMLAR